MPQHILQYSKNHPEKQSELHPQQRKGRPTVLNSEEEALIKEMVDLGRLGLPLTEEDLRQFVKSTRTRRG